MYVQQQGTVATANVLQIGEGVGFMDFSMFGEIF